MNMKIFHCFIALFYLFVGCSHQKKNRKKLADNYYELSLVELEEDNLSLSNYKQALQYVNKALAYNVSSQYLALKGTLLMQLGQFNEAENCFKKGIFEAKNSLIVTELQNNFACLQAQQGKIDSAIEIWDKLALSKDYATPEAALFNKAQCFIFRKQYLEAKKCLFEAIRFNPNYIDARFLLAKIALNYLDDLALAHSEINTILFLEPDNTETKALASHLMPKKKA